MRADSGDIGRNSNSYFMPVKGPHNHSLRQRQDPAKRQKVESPFGAKYSLSLKRARYAETETPYPVVVLLFQIVLALWAMTDLLFALASHTILE